MTDPIGSGGPTNARPTRRSRRLLTPSVYVVYVAILLEVFVRGCFAVSKDSSFLRPDMRLAVYRELRPLAQRPAPITRGDAAVDVLFLGGSVLHADFGNVADLLKERLESITGRPVTIHNVAMPAHSSRDSLHKYRLLASHRFDLVFFYHGLNEVRMNNSPPGMYRDDYTHARWYADYAVIDRHPKLRWYMTPYAMDQLWLELSAAVGWKSYLPRHQPIEALLEYGSIVRSDRSLAANLRTVMELARERGDPLLVGTFASYFPRRDSVGRDSAGGDGDLDAFAEGGRSAIHLWGRPAHVMAALERHNIAIRAAADAWSAAMLVDLAARMGGDRECFRDECHLSRAGSRRFVELLLPHALRLVSPSFSNPQERPTVRR